MGHPGPMNERIAKRSELQGFDAPAQRRLIAVMGAIFGLFLIFGVGFAQPDALHNAAHDARHSFAFPCH